MRIIVIDTELLTWTQSHVLQKLLRLTCTQGLVFFHKVWMLTWTQGRGVFVKWLFCMSMLIVLFAVLCWQFWWPVCWVCNVGSKAALILPSTTEIPKYSFSEGCCTVFVRDVLAYQQDQWKQHSFWAFDWRWENRQNKHERRNRSCICLVCRTNLFTQYMVLFFATCRAKL